MNRYDQLCFGAFQYIEPSEQKSEIIKRSLPQLEFYHLLLVFYTVVLHGGIIHA